MADHAQLTALLSRCSSNPRIFSVASLTAEIIVLVFVAKLNSVPIDSNGMSVPVIKDVDELEALAMQINPSGPKPLAFSSVELLAWVAALKFLLSAFLYQCQVKRNASMPNIRSFAFLGIFYGILNFIGYGPFNAERYFVPSDTRIVSILLIPTVMFCLNLEHFDSVRLISVGFLVAATRAVGAFLATPEDPYNYIFVATYAILRVYHSMELKKNQGISVHVQNMVLSTFTLGTYFTIYTLQSSGIFVLHSRLSSHGITPGISCLTVTLLQSLVEIVASISYKKVNAIVAEFSMTLASLLVTLSLSQTEMPEVLYLKAIAIVLAVVAIYQYFQDPNQLVAEPQPSNEKPSSDDEDETTNDIYKEKAKAIKEFGARIQDTFRSKISKNIRFLILLLVTLGHFSKNNPELCKIDPGTKALAITTNKVTTGFTVPNVHSKLFYEKTLTVMVALDLPNDYIEKTLISFEKFCMDCDRVRFLFVVSGNLTEAERLKNRFSFFNRFEIATFPQVFLDLNEPIDVYSEARLLEEKGFNTFHSFRRLNGCLYANTTYCWMLHPESFMIKKMYIQDLVIDYFRDPYLVYSSHSRVGNRQLRATADILGYREHIGWPVEEYMWIMELSILRRLKEIIDQKYPSPRNYPTDLQIEIMYYLYIMHNLHRYPYYRIIDSSNIFGPYWDKVRPQGGPIEDIRIILFRNATLVLPIAERYVSYGLRFFRGTDGGLYGDINTSIRFLDLATTVQMVVGSQMPEIILCIGGLILIGLSTVAIYLVSSGISESAPAVDLPVFDPAKVKDFTQLVCSPASPEPPKIAVCMAGAARTLKYPIVYKSIKNNVIDALGGEVKLFAYLKMHDNEVTDKDNWRDWPDPTNTREDQLSDALIALKPEVLKFTYDNVPVPVGKASTLHL
ncbi:hypothetical protein HDU97_007192 [Phlyctochytrium planicorne]|nr:hypothetical protein HDU97_007192 [Phlyctochytrium planicorne]